MRANKRLLILFFAVGILGTVMAVGQFDRRNGKEQNNQRKEEPTVLLSDEQSPRQREHGKLFKHKGRKLQDIAANQTGDVEVIEEEGYVIEIPDSSHTPTFIKAVCNADAVILGTLKTKSSQLTSQGNFIFTDYEVVVDEVIKNHSVTPIRVGTIITTTRDGGAVSINQRVLRATRADFDAPVIGNQYLLFVRFIPTTGSYLIYGNGTFEIRDNRVSALGPDSRRELKKRPTQDASIFLNELRSTTESDCSSKK